MSGAIEQTAHNAAIYDSPERADWYARLPLSPAETAVCERYREAFAGKRVLDLGVGSGRTTQALAPLAASYLGIDLSAHMIEHARRAYPNASFTQMDVRDIARFGRGQFDCVFGSCAIISAFTHEERLRILDAVRHLLSPGGYFIFTAHNRKWRNAGAMPLNRRSWRPWQLMRALHPMSWVHYFEVRPLRREETDYAILNDDAHLWRGIFYYIDRDAQKRQLAAAGFELLEVIGDDGVTLPEGADTARSGLLQYVCRVGPFLDQPGPDRSAGGAV